MECYDLAIEEVKSLFPGEIFLVRDLFKGYEWNRFDIGERRVLGSLFLKEVQNGELKKIVRYHKKSSANQHLYIKLENPRV